MDEADVSRQNLILDSTEDPRGEEVPSRNVHSLRVGLQGDVDDEAGGAECIAQTPRAGENLKAPWSRVRSGHPHCWKESTQLRGAALSTNDLSQNWICVIKDIRKIEET